MKQRPMHIMRPVKREVLSARQYQKLAQTQPHLIERSRFIPPSIGSPGFGRFDVVYSVPMLRPQSA
ncbi:hypothetical protein CLI92_08985 [Vandammella animalimorsus]|uniref:Uncharacterized protein n=1 Tax=Vandammella animalimorsus TaxID=2029117 RepID=A0A2A2T4W5_9BURK|nr:hypothetical protein [Vandammella animalimorsus]PAT31895.1 hypothetical protein CK626_07820 [Vandammella animalimorsus]PAX16458.1 hypothetical protein CLI92_08985 [Vandammella animalimorsus]PAX18873.1 hypothetical protein CLI93_11065 [Vandammella animalimorsus]